MKKIILMICLIAGMGAVLFAQQLTVAVSTFEARGGLTKDDADAITEIFISALVADGLVNVVDRSSFDMIISEMKFQASDWTDSERVLQLGKMLKATSIIRGTVMSLGGQVAITSNILDLNTAQLISSSTLRMGSLDEVFDKMPAFVKDITSFLFASKTYKIGDKGPGGGLVFFIEGNVRKEATLFLGTANFPSTGYSVSIGPLINKVNEYKGGGYSNWYLPSIRELELIYNNLQKSGLANYIAGAQEYVYWSSESAGVSGGGYRKWYVLSFSDGRRYEVADGNYCYCAVRAF